MADLDTDNLGGLEPVGGTDPTPPPPAGFFPLQQTNPTPTPPPSGFVPVTNSTPTQAAPIPQQDDGFLSMRHLKDVGKGFVKGAVSTVAGIDDIAHDVGEKIHPGLGDWLTTPLNQESGHTSSNGATGKTNSQVLRDKEHQLAQTHNTAQNVGYAGETLAEFMLGDEALKGLSMADRLTTVAKWMKIAEKGPRLMQALKFGATAAKAGTELTTEEAALVKQYPKLAKLIGIGQDALRAGVVQGTHTTVRSGGDVHAGISDAAAMTATAGVLGTATGAASHVVARLGNAASKAQRLATLADAAPGKAEVADKLGQLIDNAKNELHQGYEAGVNDLKERLGDSSVSAQTNPLADRAKTLLAEPDPAEHPFVAQAKKVAGDRLDKPVRNLIDSLATGKLAGQVAEGAENSSGLLDAQGQPLSSALASPKATLAPPYTVDDLIQLRQTVRQLADNYDYGDINSRALRQLLPAVDDTIGQLADLSGDQTAVSDYQALRDNYRSKIGLFDDPVIQKLRAGKVDDAARDFVGTIRQGTALPSAGKVSFNTDVLKGIIGDDGLKAFGRDVFGTMLKDSTQDGRFNPEKFIKTWKRITPETQNDLFDVTNVKSGLQDLVEDAQSATTLQKVTKAVLGTGLAGTAIGAGLTGHAGFGLLSAVGLLSAEGGAIMAGRELLNYMATHPKVWSGYESAARVANTPAAKRVASLGTIGAGKIAASVYSGLAGPLGGDIPMNEKAVTPADPQRDLGEVRLPVTNATLTVKQPN